MATWPDAAGSGLAVIIIDRRRFASGRVLALPNLCLKLPDHPGEIRARVRLVFCKEISQCLLKRARVPYATLDYVTHACECSAGQPQVFPGPM
jgi:hypothetical protein